MCDASRAKIASRNADVLGWVRWGGSFFFFLFRRSEWCCLQNLEEAEIGREGRRRTIDATSVGATVVVAVFVGHRSSVDGLFRVVLYSPPPRGNEGLGAISGMCLQTRTYDKVHHFLAWPAP